LDKRVTARLDRILPKGQQVKPQKKQTKMKTTIFKKSRTKNNANAIRHRIDEEQLFKLLVFKTRLIHNRARYTWHNVQDLSYGSHNQILG
jgi:hypothetical protein